jgi:hypothetical protein
MMLRYHFFNWMQRLRAHYAAGRCARQMNAMLRRNGFTQISRGDWQK